jgi:hypothetical protein
MNKLILVSLVLALGLNLVFADLYIQNPRGSNNRLHGDQANRKNNNRLFDSQNNNRGGYNVGEATLSRAGDEKKQYRMKYFQSGVVGNSELTVQFTNQHGCGNEKLNCNIVLQYRCQDDVEDAAPKDTITMRNGRSSNTPPHTAPNRLDEKEAQQQSRRKSNIKDSRGLHEPWQWYDSCHNRLRNKGLFTADQNLQKNKKGPRIESAIHTRQNADGDRSGYECPEERDYYPYFHPTPWTDIAVLAQNEKMCNYYKKKSFNEQTYGECVEEYSGGNRRHFSNHNNPKDCEAAGGKYVQYHSMLELAPQFTTEQQCQQANKAGLGKRGVYKWGKPYDEKKIYDNEHIVDTCFFAPPSVDCKVAEYSRVNHLGDGQNGRPHNYTWTLPHFPSLKQKRCVLRMRYNISTNDYDPLNTFAESNDNDDVIENNPEVDAGDFELQLAINTAQYGRTFQDRTHIFFIAPRPEEIKDEKKLFNLNVRGKRGNLVQTLPATEYDFVPNNLEMKSNDLVHIQWTGSNTHNNNNQGNSAAGEGKQGTDRHNIMQLSEPGKNVPMLLEQSTMFDSMTVVWNSKDTEHKSSKDIAAQLASAGYYECADVKQKCNKSTMQDQLDNALPSYAGLVTSMKKGTYYYMCTRNNNFTNRSQKGKIVVK